MKYTMDELRAAVKESFSLYQVLKKLNLVPTGGSSSCLRKKLKKNNIDTRHFKKPI